MVSLPSFKMSPRIPSGPTDLFLSIDDNHFLSRLVLTVNGLPESVDQISVILCSQLNIDA
jgi:hypothetical protein